MRNTPTPDTNLQDFYMESYPWDELGEEIIDHLTFKDLFEYLDHRDDEYDIYDFMGVHDSIVRERLFSGLSEVTGHTYNEIYNQWLFGHTEEPKS